MSSPLASRHTTFSRDWTSYLSSPALKVPLAVGVPAVPLPTPPASTTEPVAVPEITAASLVPLIVIVTTLAVPSTVLTVNVSVVLWPLFRPSTRSEERRGGKEQRPPSVIP